MCRQLFPIALQNRHRLYSKLTGGRWHNSRVLTRNFVVVFAALIIALEAVGLVVLGLSVTLVASLNWEQTLDPAAGNDAGAALDPGFAVLLWATVGTMVAICWFAVLGLIRSRRTSPRGPTFIAVVTVGIVNAGASVLCIATLAGGSLAPAALLAIAPFAMVAAVTISIACERFTRGPLVPVG